MRAMYLPHPRNTTNPAALPDASPALLPLSRLPSPAWRAPTDLRGVIANTRAAQATSRRASSEAGIGRPSQYLPHPRNATNPAALPDASPALLPLSRLPSPAWRAP